MPKQKDLRKNSFQVNSHAEEGYKDIKFLWEQLQIMEWAQDHNKIQAIGKKYGWEV